MSIVVLVLTLAVIAAAVGLLVAMYGRNKPFYGVVALGLLLGPATILAFTYLTVA
jgi:hypothetical protein